MMPNVQSGVPRLLPYPHPQRTLLPSGGPRPPLSSLKMKNTPFSSSLSEKRKIPLFMRNLGRCRGSGRLLRGESFAGMVTPTYILPCVARDASLSCPPTPLRGRGKKEEVLRGGDAGYLRMCVATLSCIGSCPPQGRGKEEVPLHSEDPASPAR